MPFERSGDLAVQSKLIFVPWLKRESWTAKSIPKMTDGGFIEPQLAPSNIAPRIEVQKGSANS